MKLAELLIKRKAEKGNLAFLEGRLKANARVQEGEAPQESPGAILAKVRVSIDLLSQLTRIINRANMVTTWEGPEGVSLADALIVRDALAKKRRVLTGALEAITTKEPRYGRMEIKYVPMLEAATLITQIDEVTKEYAELETRIQQVNWTTEVK